MRAYDFVLADYGPIILSKNLVQVDFDNVDEFAQYVGEESASFFRGKDYFYYEPGSAIFNSQDESVTWDSVGAMPELDALMERVPELAEQKADPYFLLDEAQSLELAQTNLQYRLIGLLRVTDPFLLPDSILSDLEQIALIEWRNACRDYVKGVTTFDEATNPNFPVLDTSVLNRMAEEEPFVEEAVKSSNGKGYGKDNNPGHGNNGKGNN